MRDKLIIRGAREHNLRDVSLDLPRDALIVFTGLSGSGKSSLAFDTIFAEGQRRYVESLSAYARQFLERMEKPDVDRIDGIAPAIAIRQKNTVRNPRSTVGTTTEIHDYMRLLFARVGRTFCRQCGREVIRETAEVVAKQLSSLPDGTRLLVGFDVPIIEVTAATGDQTVDEVAEQLETTEEGSNGSGSNGSKGSSSSGGSSPAAVEATLDALKRKGFQRLLVDSKAVSFDDVDVAALARHQQLQVVVDRVQTGADDIRQRLTDSIETSYLEGGGSAWAVELPSPQTPVPSPQSP